MQVVMDAGRLAGLYFQAELEAAAEEPVSPDQGDTVDFSQEAVRRYRDSLLEPMVKSALSLEHMDQRIAQVRAEIAAVWNSALPDEEKYRQISSKELEISLLQAGQYQFAKAGFYRAA